VADEVYFIIESDESFVICGHLHAANANYINVGTSAFLYVNFRVGFWLSPADQNQSIFYKNGFPSQGYLQASLSLSLTRSLSLSLSLARSLSLSLSDSLSIYLYTYHAASAIDAVSRRKKERKKERERDRKAERKELMASDPESYYQVCQIIIVTLFFTKIKVL
jgi:hypothetical protein